MFLLTETYITLCICRLAVKETLLTFITAQMLQIIFICIKRAFLSFLQVYLTLAH